MDLSLVEETIGCTFKWIIQNISHCWMEEGRYITSPALIADTLEGTKWLLQLCLKAYSNKNNAFLYLTRSCDCEGPTFIDVDYKLTLLNRNGECLTENSVISKCFKKDSFSPPTTFSKEKVFVSERDSDLSNDMVTVICMIWKKGTSVVKSQQVSVYTNFSVIKRSFVWKIDNFSKIRPGCKSTFKDNLVDFTITLDGEVDFDKFLVVNIIFLDTSIKYFSLKMWIEDSKGNKVDCGTREYFAEELNRGMAVPVLFTKIVKENKREYLSNDVLSLSCEYLYSTGAVLYELCGKGVIYPKITNETSVKTNDPSVTNNSTKTTVLVNDLEFMFKEGFLSDMELRTSTKNFPVHKNILSARSPVFRRMFENDMKEKNSGFVEISDLEDNILQRLLLYVYTDTIKNLQFENAIKLFAAADKYEILSLRNRCSSFLKKNLCVKEACAILSVADLHQDEDLKNGVQDYILNNDDIFCSQEWIHLMDTNLKLAADTMHRKYLRSQD